MEDDQLLRFETLMSGTPVPAADAVCPDCGQPNLFKHARTYYFACGNCDYVGPGEQVSAPTIS